MARSRSPQVTFNNIAGATRFKTSEGSRLMRAVCLNKGCGAADSREHFQECYQIPDLSGHGRQTRLAEIIKICERVEVPNVARPRPSGEQFHDRKEMELETRYAKDAEEQGEE